MKVKTSDESIGWFEALKEYHNVYYNNTVPAALSSRLVFQTRPGVVA